MTQTVNVPGVGLLQFPDGMSQQDMAAAIQKNFPQIHAAPDPAKRDLPGYDGSGNQIAAQSSQTDNSSLWDKIKGAGEAGLSTIGNVVAGGIGQVGGTLGALAGQIATGEYGTPQGAQRAAEVTGDAIGRAVSALPQPSGKGAEYSRAIGQALDDSGIAGLPIGPEMAVAGHLAAPALGQARAVAVPALQDARAAAGGAVDRAAAAVADSPEAYMAGKAAQAAREAVTPSLDPERAALARKAMDMGITIPPHALSDNSFVRMAGEFLDGLPFSGSTKAANRDAFNRYLIDQIGGDTTAKRLTPDVFAQAQSQSGKVIGDTFAKIAVPADDPQLLSDLTDLLQAQGRELDPTKKLIEGNVQELGRIVQDNGGVIPGTALKAMHSEVLAKLRSNLDAYPGMRQQLNDFQEILEDAAARQITDPDMQAAYDTARVQYAKSKTLEPLVAKGGINGVSPQALLGRVTATSNGKHLMATGRAGDLGDAAAVAQQFMKEQPSSGTAERGFMINALTDLYGVGKAALALPIANVYNRFGPRMAQAMVDQAMGRTKQPLLAPQALELAEESPFGPAWGKSAAGGSEPYNGLLQLADPSDPAYAVTGLEGKSASSPTIRAPDISRLATRHDVPTLDFPLRQEVLQQPEIASAIDAFRAEDARLSQVASKAIAPPVREKAKRDLQALREEFANGMRQLGIQSPQDAHGLNRPLYESQVRTMPIQKTFVPAPMPSSEAGAVAPILNRAGPIRVPPLKLSPLGPRPEPAFSAPPLTRPVTPPPQPVPRTPLQSAIDQLNDTSDIDRVLAEFGAK